MEPTKTNEGIKVLIDHNLTKSPEKVIQIKFKTRVLFACFLLSINNLVTLFTYPKTNKPDEQYYKIYIIFTAQVREVSNYCQIISSIRLLLSNYSYQIMRAVLLNFRKI